MFGLSKQERRIRAVSFILQTDYYLTKLQADALAADVIVRVKLHIELPEQAALPIAAVEAKMLYDGRQLDRAEQLNKRVRIVGADLLRQGKILKGQLAELLSFLPGLEEEEDGERLDKFPSVAIPSRVQCVRAGWVFTVYWQFYDANPDLRGIASTAEDNSMTKPLLSVFANSRKNLDWVSAKYREGRGSNEILRMALGGSPEYTLHWFRIGQVVNTLLDTGVSPDEMQYSLGELSVRGNVSSGGVSKFDCDRLLDLAREARECHRRDDSKADLMRLISDLQGCLIEIAAKHDNLEEFEQRSKAHGGVFISYSHSDAKIAKALAREFEANEIAYWLDENEVTPGNMVSTTLTDGIANSCIFLLLVSRASLNSEWVMFEIDRAHERAQDARQVLIPILTDNLSHDDLPEKLRDIVSFSLGTSLEASFPTLIDAIREHLVSNELRRQPRSRSGNSVV